MSAQQVYPVGLTLTYGGIWDLATGQTSQITRVTITDVLEQTDGSPTYMVEANIGDSFLATAEELSAGQADYTALARVYQLAGLGLDAEGRRQDGLGDRDGALHTLHATAACYRLATSHLHTAAIMLREILD